MREVLGGAGNVAANAAALGGKVTLMGIVGNDARAKTLARLCGAQGIRAMLFDDSARPTTAKVRFVAGHHQLARIDIEETKPIARALEARVVKKIHSLPKHDMVIVSDYAKGCLTKGIVQALRARFGEHTIIADMKPVNAEWYKNILAVTPNLKEAADITGVYADTDALAERVTKLLGSRLKTSVVLTRGARGVSVRVHGKPSCEHFRNSILTVKDVTGAGDTLVAALALMCASGASFVEAAELANDAAGIVVGAAGTIALSRKALVGYLQETTRAHTEA